jgi:murein DD-endopeptidase MepM/ murein hydrolase activator NlpD
MFRGSWPCGVLVALALAGCAPPEDTEDLTPPGPAALARDIGLPAEIRVVAAKVARGSTLPSLLRAHDVPELDVAQFVTHAAAVFDPRLLRVDQPYRIALAIGGALRRFEYEIDRDRVLTVARKDDGFVASIDRIPKITSVAPVAASVDRDASSLFAALTRSGEQVDLAVALATVFASDVDFNTELQPGDTFRLIVEKQYRSGDAGTLVDEEPHTFAGYGPILAAELHNDGRHLKAFRFTTADGKAAYFDENGASLNKFFLSSPLRFDPVITSRFSTGRLHPVTGTRRPHLGVDYRAPVGAPVVAVADGVVVSSGWNGDAGRMVHLRHANGFESQYLHLSAATVTRGERVRQGDLIGRVGATGLVTGPHLDYRLRKNGVFLNPVTAHRAMPPGEPIPADQMPGFLAERDRLLAELQASK